jgi:hypothetical protein
MTQDIAVGPLSLWERAGVRGGLEMHKQKRPTFTGRALYFALKNQD